jgi:TIR domain-containing protein
LRAGLQSFNKRWNSFRSVEVYLDDTNLAANPSLRRSIEEAVKDSEYFILLASPSAAESEWVHDELRMFLALNPADHSIIVLGSGRISWSKDGDGFDWSATTAVPRHESVFRSEPKYVDLSWISDPEHLDVANPRFRADIARVVAGSSDHSLDELISEDIQKFRAFRRRHLLTTSLRAALAFGCVPLIFVLAPNIAIYLRNFLPSIASGRVYDFLDSFQQYFPFGEALLLLGALAALAAGAGIRASAGFAAGYLLLAPLNAFSALKTYQDDVWERLIVCLMYALLFAVAGGLGAALCKRIRFSTGAAAFGVGGLCAAALRFFYPATENWVNYPVDVQLPIPVLRGPWLASRIHIAVTTLKPRDLLLLWSSLDWHAPVMIAGGIAGLLLGWRLGEAELPSPDRRTYLKVSSAWKWVTGAAFLVCILGLAAPTVPKSERRQMDLARSELSRLARTELVNIGCETDFMHQAPALFALRDVLRQMGPSSLYAQVVQRTNTCEQSWAQFEVGRFQYDLPSVYANLTGEAFDELISAMQNGVPAARQIEDLPTLEQAWRMVRARSAELQVFERMKDSASSLPVNAIALRARYAEAFWRSGDLDEARAVLAPAIRHLKSFQGDRRKLYNSGLEPSDGITLWRTGVWQSLPEWRVYLQASFGVLTAIAVDGAPVDQILRFCQTNRPIAGSEFQRIALEIAEKGSPSEGVAALDVINTCALGGQGGFAMQVLRLGLDQAVAAKNEKAVHDYISRIHRLLNAASTGGGTNIPDDVGIPAACALANAGELDDALGIAVKVSGGSPEPAPTAIVCVAKAERLAGHKDRALAILHRAWSAVTPMHYNPGPEGQRKAIALELAELGEFDSARIVSHECDESLNRLEVLARILRISQLAQMSLEKAPAN